MAEIQQTMVDEAQVRKKIGQVIGFQLTPDSSVELLKQMLKEQG